VSSSYDRKDKYYNLAKEQGFRSRAAFKLKELDKKYKLLERGFKVADLGAWPGGWMQVAAQTVGPRGLVVGIDLAEIEEFQDDNVLTIVGDVRDEEVILKAKEAASGYYDLVLSDMSPKLIGIKEADRAGAVGCAELALWACEELLKTDGTLVIKVFKNNETDEFVKVMRKSFTKIVRSELETTRKTSDEYYCLGFGFKR
jgi:23S rRNA (uridine2552-2'-O)-methyltransferase